jgi:4-amino-4-deoxy-L-arabinose transferase-like glycosyltransferase
MKNFFYSSKSNLIFKKYPDIIPYLILLIIAVIFFETAPKNGAFWWSESPRNALNGAFVLDFIKEMPFTDPVNWAKQYYYQYPALTILFYPPMLYLFIAAFYFAFGVSHSSALACITVFCFFLGLGIYKLACRIVARPSAIAASILFFSSPEVIIWAQQIMLEIPMMTFAVWSAWFLIKYCETEKWQDLFICALLILSASYTKQIAAVIGLSFVVALVIGYGRQKFTSRHMLVIASFSILVLVPLVMMQIKFGAFNVVSVVNRPDFKTDHLSIENIFWYLKQFPKMMGWGLFFFSFFGIVGGCLNREWLAKKPDILIHVCWFSIGYIVMTAIHFKEPRHGIFLLIPLIFAAALFLDHILAKPYLRLAPPIVATFLLISTIIHNPTPRIEGYNTASDLIAQLAPHNANVLFAGNQDGNFIFNLRENENRRDIHIIRADKLFLNISIMPNHGLNPKDLTYDQIRQIINQLGISYVVTVPHIWSETAPMAYLAQILESKEFHEVKRLAVTGNTADNEVVIYKNLNPLPSKPVGFDMELRAIGMVLKGNQ